MQVAQPLSSLPGCTAVAAAFAAAVATLDSPNFCNACICGVGVALVVGLDAAGVKVNGQPLSALAVSNSSAVNGVLTQCQTTLGLQLLQSGTVTADAVTQLGKCDVQAAGNNCLGQVQSGTVGGVATPVVAPGNVPAAAAVLQAARNGASMASGVQSVLGLLAAAMAAALLV
jgi:hypothetical protein